MKQQPSLFDPPPTPPKERVVNVELIRKHLVYDVTRVRRAIRMPWNDTKARYWEREIPKLAKYLPPEEGEAITTEFQMHMKRLWATTLAERAAALAEEETV